MSWLSAFISTSWLCTWCGQPPYVPIPLASLPPWTITPFYNKPFFPYVASHLVFGCSNKPGSSYRTSDKCLAFLSNCHIGKTIFLSWATIYLLVKRERWINHLYWSLAVFDFLRIYKLYKRVTEKRRNTRLQHLLADKLGRSQGSSSACSWSDRIAGQLRKSPGNGTSNHLYPSQNTEIGSLEKNV